MTSYSPKDIIKFLQSKGWVVDHISGSHHIMKDPASGRRTIVAIHKKDLPEGTLHAILRQTGFTKTDL